MSDTALDSKLPPTEEDKIGAQAPSPARTSGNRSNIIGLRPWAAKRLVEQSKLWGKRFHDTRKSEHPIRSLFYNHLVFAPSTFDSEVFCRVAEFYGVRSMVLKPEQRYEGDEFFEQLAKENQGPFLLVVDIRKLALDEQHRFVVLTQPASGNARRYNPDIGFTVVASPKEADKVNADYPRCSGSFGSYFEVVPDEFADWGVYLG